MGHKLRLAVFVSGGGSNLQAILDACTDPGFPAEVVSVVANEPGAGGLERARRAGVAALAVDHRDFGSRRQHERAILDQLEPYRPELAVLAGYMRLVTPVLLAAFADPAAGRPGVINIHPADTRAYQGAHGYEFAMGLLQSHPERLDETRITVHFVDAGMDTGPIIRQARVPVYPDDTLADLRRRGLAVEHRLYPQVIRLLAEGRVQVVDGRVLIDGRQREPLEDIE